MLWNVGNSTTITRCRLCVLLCSFKVLYSIATNKTNIIIFLLILDINRGVESRTPLCESSLSDVSIYSANSGQTLTNSDSSQISLKQVKLCIIIDSQIVLQF